MYLLSTPPAKLPPDVAKLRVKALNVLTQPQLELCQFLFTAGRLHGWNVMNSNISNPTGRLRSSALKRQISMRKASKPSRLF
jgi:hypothetical protein